ncbi:hypothetical protein F5Y13DRAFT_205053 [Hypoxylon sp. FL1857]|nr:hypothetical protein F5Y13DRAFT_205053 [Hypoxylon sp. FL1857]
MVSQQRDIATQENMNSEPDPNGTDVAPPAYDNLHAGLGDSGLPMPPPATHGQFYFEKQISEAIELAYARRSLTYWSLDNVQWEDGYISKTLPEPNNEYDKFMNQYLIEKGLMVTRHYFLRDLQVPSRWVAHFQIHAATVKVLTNMRLENLSTDNIDFAHAWSDGRQRSIYQYRRSHPEGCYNAIYDDMPMGGWWPWPKKRDS